MKAIRLKVNSHLLKEENQLLNLIVKFSTKFPIFIKNFQIKKILTIGFGVNIPFMRHLLVKERSIGFGVLQKSFLQINSIFCLRTLNQKESS